VGSGIDEKTWRAEERRFEDEVHEKAADHLDDDQDTDDTTGTAQGVHGERLPAGSTTRPDQRLTLRSRARQISSERFSGASPMTRDP
jgi:hypothetical protein